MVSTQLTSPKINNAGPLIRCGSLSLAQRIVHQQGLLRRQEFTILGRMKRIIFDPRGMDAPTLERPTMNPNSLDFMDFKVWLGLSPDQQDLLVISNVPVPLPDLPDTRVHPPLMVAQRYTDLTRKTFKEFLVIQPVYIIEIKPKGMASAGLITAATGFDDTQMAFLVNPQARTAHFVGGRFHIDVK